VAAGGIGIEIASHEIELFDAALQLADAIRGGNAGRLGQLADAHKIIWVKAARAIDQIIANLRPLKARCSIAEVMPHSGRPWRENRDVGAALPLEFELRLFQALSDLVVADVRRRRGVIVRISELTLPPSLQFTRRSGVMAVTIDDHAVTKQASEQANSRTMVGC